VVMKPRRLNIVAQGLCNSLPRSFFSTYTHLSLSLSGWALTRLEASVLAESITRKERGSHASRLQTYGQANLVVSCYTTFVPPLLRLFSSLVQPARQASALVGEEGTRHPVKERKQCGVHLKWLRLSIAHAYSQLSRRRRTKTSNVVTFTSHTEYSTQRQRMHQPENSTIQYCARVRQCN